MKKILMREKMKKLLVILTILFFTTTAFSFDSQLGVTVGPNGSIRGETNYIITGSGEQAIENQFQQSIFFVGSGSFGSVGNFSGDMKYQEQGITKSGTFMFDSKMGTGSLIIVDQNTGAIVELNAAGVDGKLIGSAGQTVSIYNTAGGLGLQHQTVGIGSLAVGAESVVISIFPIGPNGERDLILHATDVGLKTLEQLQQKFVFGGPLDVKYSVTFAK